EHSIKLQLPAGNVGFMRRLRFVVEWKAMKAPAKAELVNSQKLRHKALTDLLRAEREDIRLSGLDGSHRRALLSVAAFTAAAKRDELKVIFKAENSSLRKEKLPSYREWVANYAEAGDPAAIAQLRGFSYADKRKGKHPQEPDVATYSDHPSPLLLIEILTQHPRRDFRSALRGLLIVRLVW
ncbi:hypothetical protein PSA5_21125, partial [Pseudomonas syringae pv. actinidiae]